MRRLSALTLLSVVPFILTGCQDASAPLTPSDGTVFERPLGGEPPPFDTPEHDEASQAYRQRALERIATKKSAGEAPLGRIGEESVYMGRLHVPRDYVKIQKAVDAALPGQTVIIWGGTYQEEIVIVTPGVRVTAKGFIPVNLIGGLSIEAEDVHIDGFNIRRDGSGVCVFATNADGIVIRDMGFSDASYGIWLEESSGGMIANIHSETTETGIVLTNGCSENHIMETIVKSGSRDALLLSSDSNSNKIFRNTFDNNGRLGILLSGVTGNFVSQNSCDSNGDTGIALQMGSVGNRLDLNSANSNSTNYGIWVLGSSGTDTGNWLRFNEALGNLVCDIVVGSSGNRLQKNTADCVVK